MRANTQQRASSTHYKGVAMKRGWQREVGAAFDALVEVIRDAYREGYTPAEIARAAKLKTATVKHIVYDLSRPD